MAKAARWLMGGLRSGLALASALALKCRIERTRLARIAQGDRRLLKTLADLVTNLFHDFSVLLPVSRFVITGERYGKIWEMADPLL
jgi:hypothetical protein